MFLFMIAAVIFLIAVNGIPILSWNGGVIYSVVEFSFLFLKFMLKITSVLCTFCLHIFTQLFGTLISCLPFVWRLICSVWGFANWTLRQLVRGVFGCGNYFLSTISWLMVMCVCILYFETLFQRPRDNNEQVRSTVEQQNERNIQRESELDRLEYLENEQNENEENNLEEAEINIAEDDNVRNSVRERLVVPRQNRTNSANEGIHLDSGSNASDFSSESDTESGDEYLRNQSNINQRPDRQDFRVHRQQNLDRSVQNQSCRVCFERERNIAVFPCGHLLLCNNCVQLIMRQNKLCPLCRTHITEFRRIYLQ